MKKYIVAVILTFSVLIMLGISASADVSGYVYDSNTNAFIDGYQIPVYTYNNYPYVVAEDLNGYGFDCRWDSYEDILYINYNYDKGLYPYESVQLEPARGKIIETVYNANTKVKLGNEFIKAYSIGGRMLISLDDLYIYGAVNWYPETQTIAFTSRRFMDLNPDWKILMPASYVLDIVKSYVNLNSIYFQEYMSDFTNIYDYLETYGYEFYMKYENEVMWLSADIRKNLELLNGQLLLIAEAIQNNQNFYYKSDAYHMVYSVALQTQSVLTLYDKMNGKTFDQQLTIALDNGDYFDAITAQSEVLYNKYEAYADKVWKYINYTS